MCSHRSYDSSTSQCSRLIRDSPKPFLLRLMNHEFILRAPLHHPSRPVFTLFILRATQPQTCGASSGFLQSLHSLTFPQFVQSLMLPDIDQVDGGNQALILFRPTQKCALHCIFENQGRRCKNPKGRTRVMTNRKINTNQCNICEQR